MSNIVRFSPMRSLAFGSIGAAYAELGTPFDHEMRVLHFINNTDGDIFISFDGINDNAFAPANSFILYDLTSDQDTGEHFRYQRRTQIQIKYSTAPTEGDFYLVSVYARGE